MRYRRRIRRKLPLMDYLDDRCLLSAYGQPQIGGYTPAEITAAYGLNAITFKSSAGTTVNGNGAGETIALIEEYHDPNIRSDLNTFDRAYHLPDPSLTVVNLAGNQTNNTWALEESMDVEWAHAIAPGAKILVVEATPSNFQTKELQNQLDAVNIARNTPGVVAISMSWGFIERSSELSYDRYFTTPAGHTGITFIASSGDYGFSWYPSASPNVLSVGGTSLSLTSSGSYQSETAWYWSGGGYSPYEPEPSYQSTVQSTGQRSTPDVSFDANPSTGVNIYETSPRSGQGSWRVYGGTSLGAPVWAGIIAIVDQGRALEGKGSLDGATQTIPSLYALPKERLQERDSDRWVPRHRRALVTARRSVRLWLESCDRKHRDGPWVAQRAVADRRPGDEHDHDEAVPDERDWPEWKRAVAVTRHQAEEARCHRVNASQDLRSC